MAREVNKTNWIPTIVSIVVGVLFTIGATWYTIYTTKEEVQEAENERLTKVKENLVAIIEEHIVNKDSLDLNSFERLITNRSKE
jgi:flagellar basal body-associated protein FliL